LTTSERNVVLTADVLKDAASGPVKTCRSCHLQSGDESKPLPVVTKDGKQVKMDNENAYHINCFECHDAGDQSKAGVGAEDFRFRSEGLWESVTWRSRNHPQITEITQNKKKQPTKRHKKHKPNYSTGREFWFIF
jgi:nitrate/TMAO reductase-like tetraheme cytochrome c subunit